MLSAAIVWLGLGAVGAGDYLRPFGAKAFDQATLDAEGFGDRKGLARDDDGLRITLAAGGAEAGWKTPAALRVGGDCTITATLAVRKLPKPGGEDGVAIGLAVATQDVDHPDATLLREVEPDGKDIYRVVDKGAGAAAQGANQQFDPFTGEMLKPAKPPRVTFPARGTAVRLEIRREGPTLRYQVFDELAAQPREVGHFDIGTGDIAGVKLFAANRNGAEAVEVVFRDLSIRADRISGLGTAVRTIFGTVLHGDPTALEAGTLVVGGAPPQPAASPPAVPAAAAQPTAAAAATASTIEVAAARPAGGIAPIPAGGGVAPPSTATPPPAAGPPSPAAAATPPPAPPRGKVPLDEVETITFERSATLAARFVGQPNVDATRPGGEEAARAAAKEDRDKEQDKDAEKEKAAKKVAADDLTAPPPGTAAPVKLPKVEPKPNGIRDLHLALSSLREVKLQQVAIQCPTDKGQASWRLDTAGSADWPALLARAGLETWADLFLEPPAGDCHDKEFTINLTYADGQAATAKAKATAHTDPQLKFDPESPTTPLDARIYLAGDEQLFGKLDAIADDTLKLVTPWGDRVDIPMTRIVGIYMGMADHKETPEAFAKRLKAPGDKDTLLARSRDGDVVAIAGVVEAVQANKLRFDYQGKARALPLKGVEGLVLAARPPLPPPAEVRPTFNLAGGIVVSGRWAGLDATTWQVETPWGVPLKLPAADVRTVRVRGGQMTYLSDLEPSRVDETPYFGRRSPYRKDVALAGGPLKLGGRGIDKGLAVHARSALVYDLDRRYATFRATVGFDEAGRQKGRVDCRVFADGREIYANPDLRADAEPVRLDLPIAGAEQLRLVVDFGPDEDTGDRVIWGDARIYRRPPGPGPGPGSARAEAAAPRPASPPATPTPSGP